MSALELDDWCLEPMDPHGRDCECHLCGEARADEEPPECVSCGVPAKVWLQDAGDRGAWCCWHCAREYDERYPAARDSQLHLQWEVPE